MTAVDVIEWGIAAIVVSLAVFACGALSVLAYAALRNLWDVLK